MDAAYIADEGAPRGAAADWARQAETALGRLLGVPAALLVAAEIIVLLAGVIARYVFRHPLI